MLEDSELVKSGSVGSVVLGLEEVLCASRDDKVSSAPEGFDLADCEGGSSDDLDGSHVVR